MACCVGKTGATGVGPTVLDAQAGCRAGVLPEVLPEVVCMYFAAPRSYLFQQHLAESQHLCSTARRSHCMGMYLPVPSGSLGPGLFRTPLGVNECVSPKPLVVDTPDAAGPTSMGPSPVGAAPRTALASIRHTRFHSKQDSHHSLLQPSATASAQSSNARSSAANAYGVRLKTLDVKPAISI